MNPTGGIFMEKKMLLGFGLCMSVAALLVSIPIFAHHGTGVSYDSSKPIRLTGTVKEFVFLNPHAQIYFDVKGNDGKVVAWAAELNSPANLRRDGWSKETFKPGDQLTVTLHPSRAGTPVGNVDRSAPVIVNGKELPGRAPNEEGQANP
jgi:hypothetical protein